MRVDLFDFDLPEDRIALRPADPREAARMLVVQPGATPELSDSTVGNLPDWLRPGDVLVVNDTRVIPARLYGERLRGEVSARVEVTLAKRLDANNWRVFARPAKKLNVGDRVRFGGKNRACLLGGLEASVTARLDGGQIDLAFDLAGPDLDLAMAAVGTMPLPPYIAARRAPDDQDDRDYQTLFARDAGAVAAPTAGLHFTDSLISKLEETGTNIEKVTLHVGAGTFLPVKADDTSEHVMHSEWGEISSSTAQRLNDVRASGGRIVAVGTTALRVLETAAAQSAGPLAAWRGETDIFITPGHRFRAVDVLMTNFHLPRSTLFMLVSAFSGLERMKRAYAHAISNGYRFYSYGDACLLFPDGAS